MPTSAAVQEQLTRIIVQVVGVEPAAVVPSAKLVKDLGVDSLSIVEIVEQLGVTFDVYVPDDAVNELVTVQDAINAVVDHDPKVKGPQQPAPAVAPLASGTAAPSRVTRELDDEEIQERKRTAWMFARRFAVVGAALGIIFGLIGVALVNATGIDKLTLPATPTPTPVTTTSTPTSAPTTSAPSVDEEPEPTLDIASSSVSPGERIRITGSFPDLEKGATLQVQIRDKGEAWDDFPVTTRTADNGDFTTIIYTTRTGEREIRMLHKDTNAKSPTATINVG